MIDPIEEQLAQLRPTDPSRELMERLQQAHSAPNVVRVPWVRWSMAATAAAAALVLGLFLWRGETRQAPAAPRVSSAPAETTRLFVSTETRNYLMEAREVGIVDAQPDQPVRLVRCVWIDDETYRGDDGVSTMRLTRAREEIIPMALEVY